MSQKDYAREAAEYFQLASLSFNEVIKKRTLTDLQEDERICISNLISGLEQLAWSVLSLQEAMKKLQDAADQ